MFRSLLILCSLATTLAAGESNAQTAYRRAALDGRGELVLTTTKGRSIRPPKDSDQVAFAQIAISADHRTVGWTALYPNCCTSYPVPLKLVLVTTGVAHTFVGNGLPIWRWSYSADGHRVAFRQGTVHGAAPAHYELHDIGTGRLVGSFDADGDAVRGMPRWARAVR